jgi:phosphate-selective porin OprO/OprP
MLTGEAASEGIVRPRSDFDPANGQWGALQLVARYTTMSIDQSAFIAGLASAASSRETRSFTVGANWYPNPYVKLYGTFERTMFTDVTDRRPAENVILFRTQLAF